MIKNKIVLLLLISASISINGMSNQSLAQGYSLQKPLEYCNHALQEMNKRNITKQDVINVLLSTNLIQKQKFGRYRFTQQNNGSNPLKVIVIMTQTKNVVVTAFRIHQNSQQLTLDQRFQGIKNNKRKQSDC